MNSGVRIIELRTRKRRTWEQNAQSETDGAERNISGPAESVRMRNTNIITNRHDSPPEQNGLVSA